LNDCERLLLMRLSVFVGGWTLERLPRYVALMGWTSLTCWISDAAVKKSLIFTTSSADGENRYRRLETIRQYAREAARQRDQRSRVRPPGHLNLALTTDPAARQVGGWIAWSWAG
jgi:predicted ATPase